MKNRGRFRYPGFIGIGPPRTATSWMHRVLEGHVGLPRRIKETHFFSTNYSQGFDWYLKHFRGYPPSLAVGEIDPNNFDFRETPARINQHLPDCKVICSLRNPVQRTYSHYRMLQSLGFVGRQSFERTLESYLGPNMIGSGCYALHLKRWFEALGRDRVLVTFYDDVEANPQKVIDNITDFIHAPRIDLAQSAVGMIRINPRERSALHPHLAARVRRLRDALKRQQMYRTIALLDVLVFRYCFGGGEIFPELDPQTARALRDHFRPDIEALEILVERDLSPWKK